MLHALEVATADNPDINRDSVAMIAPYFPNGADKDFGYPWEEDQPSGQGSVSNALVWSGSQWSAGANNQYPHASRNVSSFYVLDELIRYFDNREIFPQMTHIVLVGHSMGGQMLQRYAAVGERLITESRVVNWIGNPSSYIWLSTSRPLSIPDCPDYDDYREGYANFEEYGMTYGVGLVKQGRDAILENYRSKEIAYARALQDQGDHSSACGANTTGSNRNERFFNFIDWFRPACEYPGSGRCDTVDLIDTSHNNGFMFNSEAGQSRIFHDNWDGSGSIAHDYGYPRAQDGDNPFPDPDQQAQPYRNVISSEWVYTADMTYQGCWSNDQAVSLETKLYVNDENSVDACTKSCADSGYSIAGMQNGNECWCGNNVQNYASKVVDMSCQWSCPSGDRSQICGGINRLSLYSAATPSAC
jgi:hypothetical protein